MLTIDELAAYLKLKPQTIYKWAQTGKVPGAKFGKEWRFRRSTIERWIDAQIPEYPPKDSQPTGGSAENAKTTRDPVDGEDPSAQERSRGDGNGESAGGPATN